MAADAVAGRERYARSLLRLASMIADRTPVRTLHAIGIFDANIFERRVMNLTKRYVEIRGPRRFAIAAACVVVGLATCVSALALRMEVAAPAAQRGAPTVLTRPVDKLKLISSKDPVYPAQAKADKDTLDGPVVLKVLIGKDGSTKAIQVTKGLRADYDKSAVDAVSQWIWQPYLLNGNPIEVKTSVTVNFTIEH
jgi:TonB family protein